MHYFNILASDPIPDVIYSQQRLMRLSGFIVRWMLK